MIRQYAYECSFQGYRVMKDDFCRVLVCGLRIPDGTDENVFHLGNTGNIDRKEDV